MGEIPMFKCAHERNVGDKSKPFWIFSRGKQKTQVPLTKPFEWFPKIVRLFVYISATNAPFSNLWFVRSLTASGTADLQSGIYMPINHRDYNLTSKQVDRPKGHWQDDLRIVIDVSWAVNQPMWTCCSATQSVASCMARRDLNPSLQLVSGFWLQRQILASWASTQSRSRCCFSQHSATLTAGKSVSEWSSPPL